jgi:hypothetical protein
MYNYLKADYDLYRNVIRWAAYRGRQVDYQGRRIAGWRKEAQIEATLKKRYKEDIGQVAVILTNRRPLQGYVFYTSAQTRLPKNDDRWLVHRRSSLPSISILERDDWIDKWQLLREIERRH